MCMCMCIRGVCVHSIDKCMFVIKFNDVDIAYGLPVKSGHSRVRIAVPAIISR